MNFPGRGSRMSGEIFISYRRSDLAHARRLYDLFKAEGVEAWYDAHVGAGQDWRQATADALSNCRVFILLYSKAASESEDIAKELAAATFSKKFVVPVRIEDIQPRGAFLYELASRNWIDAYEYTDARLAELAKTLAAIVREGLTAESVIRFEREAPLGQVKPAGRPWRPLVTAGLAVGGLAVVVAASMAMLGAATSVPGRIAYFGVSALPDDVEATEVAAAAVSATLTTFAALERDVAATADTQGTAPQHRLDRAKALGATYAISGSVNRSGDKLSISILVEDARSRTTLWTDSHDGDGVSSTALASQSAALLNDKLGCVISVRGSLPRDDMRIVAKLPEACESVRNPGPSNIERWRDLIELAPDSAWIRGNAAFAMFNAIAEAAPSSIPQLTLQAEDSLRRGQELNPNLPEVLRAGVSAIAVRGGSLMDMEKAFRDSLAAAPHGPNLLGGYGSFLLTVGRPGEAAPYGREAVALDPLSAPKLLGVGVTLANAGHDLEAAELYERMHAQFPGSGEWLLRLIHALFKGIGDVDDVLAGVPASVPSPTRACVTEIAALVRGTPPARKLAAQRARACMSSGAIGTSDGNHIRAHLGDYEGLFDFGSADLGPFTSDRLNPHRRFMFDSDLPELRLDERFAVMMEKVGLIQYWRDSGKPPEFCATENAPVCSIIAAK
jgi:hypothetical protein